MKGRNFSDRDLERHDAKRDIRREVLDGIDEIKAGGGKRRTIMGLTKIDIIDSVCEQFGIPKKDCVRIVESLLDIIKDDLDKGNDVMISGFGKWSVKAKKARKGRNPKTGKAMTIVARKVVTFKPSHVLRDAVNSGD